MRAAFAAACLFAAVTTVSCGYSLVGHGGRFPAGVNKVSVPIFSNTTKDTRIARRLTDRFIQELLATGKVRVVAAAEAEAVIKGTVTRFDTDPITFDVNRKATENRAIVTADVRMTLKGEKEPIFYEKGVTRYYEYPVTEDLALLQKEEDTAYDEISRELSQRIIALLTEGF